MNEGFKVSANLFVEVENAHTGEIERQAVHNLVVDQALNRLRNALYGDSVDLNLDRIKVGTGGTATAGNWTGLESYLATYTLTSKVKDDATKKVIIKTFIPTGDLNGQTLREIGLYCMPSDTMFARATYNQIAKTNQINVTFTWEVYFTAAEG